jgi:hypothetical protein
LFGRERKTQTGKIQNVIAGARDRFFFLRDRRRIEIRFVLFINLCEFDCERAVDEDRHARDTAFFEKLVEVIEQFLRALHREGRNHERAAGANRFADCAFELLLAAWSTFSCTRSPYVDSMTQ